MGTKTVPGPLGRLFNFGAKIFFALTAYAISITILMLLHGPITAAAGEGTWNIIFGAWVLGTLALIGLLTG